MNDLALYGVSVFMGFLAIMNPIANTPIFLGLTAGDDNQAKKKIALKSVLLAFLIITTFCLAGKLIFELFAITLPALRITGGILVFQIGLHMLQGQKSEIHHPSDDDLEKSLEAQMSIAVSPLAIPILAGPGTIATAMNFSASASHLKVAITIAAFALLCGITYAFFVTGQAFITYLGEGFIKVISRLMGLILAVIGTQMLISGVFGAINAYK